MSEYIADKTMTPRNKPHIYRLRGEWAVNSLASNDDWFFIAAHVWCMVRNTPNKKRGRLENNRI